MPSLFTTTGVVESRPVTTPASPDLALHVGQPVHVNTGSIWFAAAVLAITHTRVHVSYHLPARKLRVQPVAPWLVRPAVGICLRRVQNLCRGDELVAFDGTFHVLAEAYPTRDHRWRITYSDGTPVTLPPRAVLRVRDSTPQVTVNGVPL